MLPYLLDPSLSCSLRIWNLSFAVCEGGCCCWRCYYYYVVDATRVARELRQPCFDYGVDCSFQRETDSLSFYLK